ncbi:hypothetical protein FK220_012130 [Flavobacteriaceae bacterium TP-CH-4]|uniref:IPT/TIG domain-containing protein n=1 Tax=Pelagihabitans pacificus TaxID=2696054 RepID=A0A967ATH4_9FLAO|nr:IPT/TIG domain-containing protein [Pelagihabitans pacificus]NHF60096.1 hypothetical protein [Pelagihabitans pacificus]
MEKSKLVLHIIILMISCNSFLISCGSEDVTEIVEPINSEPSFEITDFQPTQGLEGTKITINGNNFGNTPENVEVTINGRVAIVDNVSDSKIEISAPRNDRGIIANLKLRINGQTVVSNQRFIYPGPTIDSFYPTIGVLNENIVLKGSFFTENKDEVTVTMNNSNLPIVSATRDSIVFQTNNPSFVLEQYPISIEIDGYEDTSTDQYRYGLQFNVNEDPINNNLKNGIAVCPGSGLNLNVNDNRATDSNITLSVAPTFTFNGIESPVLFTWPADNKGRDIYVDVPTSIAMGTATITGAVDGVALLVEDNDKVEIGEGSFVLESNSINKFQSIQIELSHIFRQPREMIVEFTNTADDSVITGTIINDSYSDDFTKTNLVVSALDAAGIYNVSVATSDGIYALTPLNDPQLVLTD